MFQDFEKITAGEKAPEIVNALIEIPRGSNNKYELDKKLGVLRLDRALYSSVFCPIDYGFIPQTLSQDGDPLDILVLGSEPVVPGCLVEARPIGLLNMIDSGRWDHKVLAVQEHNPRWQKIRTLNEVKELNPHLLEEIKHYFKVYKELQGKKVEVKDWENSDSAQKEILASMKRYQENHKIK
ncbi:MAG: inorganic diphosphatase [Patescibacteria group bacterium]